MLACLRGVLPCFASWLPQDTERDPLPHQVHQHPSLLNAAFKSFYTLKKKPPYEKEVLKKAIFALLLRGEASWLPQDPEKGCHNSPKV